MIASYITILCAFIFEIQSWDGLRYSIVELSGPSILLFRMKVKHMQRPGTEAIITQIHPSKPKREITKIIISQNTKRTYDQQSEQLFPKMWSLSNPNRTKNNMNTLKVKRHRNFDTKNRQQTTTKKTTALERSVMIYWGLKLA